MIRKDMIWLLSLTLLPANAAQGAGHRSECAPGRRLRSGEVE